MQEEQLSTHFKQWVLCQDNFLNYIKDHAPIGLTPSGTPKGTVLMELNELMHNYKAIGVVVRSKFSSFHALCLLFELSFLNNLLEYKANAKGVEEIVLNKEQFNKYQELNEIEKYFTYFSAFWCLYHADEDFLNHDSFYSTHNLMKYLASSNLQKRIAVRHGSIISETDRVAFYSPHYWLWFYYLGFFDIEMAIKSKKDSSFMELLSAINITELGVKLSKILEKDRKIVNWNKKAHYDTIFFDEEIEETPNTNLNEFIIPFQALFPSLKNVLLPLPVNKIVAPSANYYFKVSLNKDCYRVIAIHNQEDFVALHEAILNAFKFDNDHMYMFCMDKKGWRSKEKILCPDDNMDMDMTDLLADEIKLADYAWKVKHAFTYIFDFGDNWEFNCVLIDTKTDEKPLKKAKVIEKVGKNPEQYPDWE